MAIVSTFSKVFKLCILFIQFIRVYEFSSIIQIFITVDNCLHKNSLLDENAQRTMKNREFRTFFVISTSSLLLVFITFVYMEYATSESYTNKILILINDLTLMTIFTIEIQLYGLCRMLQERFFLLNTTLKSSISVSDMISFIRFNEETMNFEKKLRKLRAIFTIYWKLIDLLELIIKMYRLQIFFGLCLTFMHLLIDVYLMMYSITESDQATWLEALNVKPICYLYRLALVSLAGYGIKKQVKFTRIILTNSDIDLGLHDKRIKDEFIEGISSYIIIMLQYKWIDN